MEGRLGGKAGYHWGMSEADWYYVEDGQAVGPVSLEELRRRLPALGGADTLVFGPGLTTWTAARHVERLRWAGPAETGHPPPAPGRRADELDYVIVGDDMQYVEIELGPGEMVIAEAGAMMFMTGGVQMNTHLGGPGAEGQGVLGKVLSAGKRLLTGESLFMTSFTGCGPGRQQVAFAAPHPGKIVALDLSQLGGELLCQKDSFLCAARGVSVGIAFTRRLRTGLFGGEGFILQRLKGDGLAFVHAGGTICHRRLEPGQTLCVDTGCLVAFQPSVSYDIRFVGGLRNTLFGGEGLFFVQLTGPGQVWLQSLPFARLAGRINSLRASTREEGSVLGRLGGVLDGDNG